MYSVDMEHKYRLCIPLFFLLLLLPAPGKAQEVFSFFQSSVVNGVTVYGKGVVTVKSSQVVEITSVYPEKDTVTVKEHLVDFVLQCLRGTPKLSRKDVSVAVTGDDPRTVRVSMPHGAVTEFILNGEDKPVPEVEGTLLLGRFYEGARTLPFLMHVLEDRVTMFSSLLLPFGWVQFNKGRAGKITRVIPDPAGDAILKRLAEVMNAGMPPTFQGDGWRFAYLPVGK